MDYSNYDSSFEELLYSWPIIIFFLFLFFPIGLYLIIRKSTLHRRNIFTISRKTFSSAMGFIIFGVLFYLPNILFFNKQSFAELIETGNSWYELQIYYNSKILIWGNLMIIFGFLLLLLSFYQKRKSILHQKYLGLVINRELENLDEIAKKMNLSKNKIIKDLKHLKSRGFLPNYYELVIEENRIYNSKREKEIKDIQRSMELLKAKQDMDNQDKYTRVVKCPNCHANNKLIDKIGKCEYCNSYIE